MTLRSKLQSAITRYTVRVLFKHFTDDAGKRVTRYAVFARGQQVSDPLPHAEAQALRDDLTVQDLLALVGEAADAR